ncbi:MAG: L,D-transpeptidase [Ghiorsea sp.]
MVKISIAQQMLYHRRPTGVVCAYPVSTARKGAGNQQGSWQTPLGKHRIDAKIGENMPKFTAFVGRMPVATFHPSIKAQRQDWILSRILWLSGMQTGINRRGKVDSRQRYIYIHGTNEEENMGSPASHGCIRMTNDDVIHLFAHVRLGESVVITP